MQKLIFLDTETTGNDLEADRLFQVCYKFNGRLQSEYFKPSVPISIKSQCITHVTNKMIADKKAFAGSKMSLRLQRLLDKHIMLSHNAMFDIAMLEHEGLSVPQFICTLKVARYLDVNGIIPEYNLQYLRYYLELDVPVKAHEAEADVLVLEALFNRLYAKMQEKYGSHETIIEEMIKVSSQPSLLKVIHFGKHKGKRIDEIIKSDKPYLIWLLEQKLQNTTINDEDWIYTLKYYLEN